MSLREDCSPTTHLLCCFRVVYLVNIVRAGDNHVVIDNSDGLGVLHAGNPVHFERHSVAREMAML